MSDTVIRVENLSKKYVLGNNRSSNGLRHLIHNFATTPLHWLKGLSSNPERKSPNSVTVGPKQAEIFWALKDVSIEIKKGEVIGIIGRNGAGKSTLLKILSRITEQTEGRVEITGRVASLLEVGTGFHPELTGRENVFLNGAILGMSRAEIKKKFDEIVAFAEVEKFLDTPAKRYSSGMYVRLAFAVAAHLEPDILIVDEVLAVGDQQFQKKCMGKMESVARGEGRTVVFVSHNIGAVESLCSRGVLIQKGSLDFDGNTKQAITRYLTAFERPVSLDLEQETERSGSGIIRFRNVSMLSHGEKTFEAVSGATIHFAFTYSNPQNLGSAELVFTIYTDKGVAVTNIHSSMMGEKITLQPGSGIITCCLPRLALNQGRYRVAAAIQDESGENYDHVPSAMWFEVTHSKFYPTSKSADTRYSMVLTDHFWSHQKVK